MAGGATLTRVPSERTRVRRRPARGAYDREVIDAILDEGLVCHVGFVHDGQPYVVPTTYARVGDLLYVHGAAASRMLRVLAEGVPVCVTVTLLDGLVLARSAFHHSMNYRSVVVLGVAAEVIDEAERLRALRAIVEHVVPGRWPVVRPPTSQELRATSVLRLPLAEASAKIRTGGPLDDAEDLARPVWAGHVPLRLVPLAPVADAGVPADATPPEPPALTEDA
jgi:nitroimidazol reductase NimA-like FMN-containing flavoprotein (pyridoxamine 5'-phosphate oxidase superfamily)